VGNTVHVGGVTYTMGQTATLSGMPASGLIYGWSGGGVVIYLMNPRAEPSAGVGPAVLG
jgi:hypothetical protein